MPAAGGKSAIDDTDLLIGLARQNRVEHANRAIDAIHLLISDHEAEAERVVPVRQARDAERDVALFARGEIQGHRRAARRLRMVLKSTIAGSLAREVRSVQNGRPARDRLARQPHHLIRARGTEKKTVGCCLQSGDEFRA